MLVDEHSDTDTAHQESVQKVLNFLLYFAIDSICLLYLKYSLEEID